MFGPVRFKDLHLSPEIPFDYLGERQNVLMALQSSSLNAKSVCVHGYQVKVKARNLKRRSSLLKHSRFLRNLEVIPNGPPPKEETKEEGEEAANEDD